jgi:hypothetical protein
MKKWNRYQNTALPPFRTKAGVLRQWDTGPARYG